MARDRKPMRVGMVRRADGTPKIDDPDRMPDALKMQLSDDDLKKLDRKTVKRLGLEMRLKD